MGTYVYIYIYANKYIVYVYKAVCCELPAYDTVYTCEGAEMVTTRTRQQSATFFGLLLAEMTENDASFLFHFYWHFIKKNYRRTNYEKKNKKIINRIDTLVVCFGIDIHVRRHASVGCLWKDGRSFFQVPAPHALILLHCNNKGFQRAFWARA